MPICLYSVVVHGYTTSLLHGNPFNFMVVLPRTFPNLSYNLATAWSKVDYVCSDLKHRVT